MHVHSLDIMDDEVVSMQFKKLISKLVELAFAFSNEQILDLESVEIVATVRFENEGILGYTDNSQHQTIGSYEIQL